jgi:hypothetical protein
VDVLEVGDGPGAQRTIPRATTIVAGVALGALVIIVTAGAMQWWRVQADRSQRLEIASVEAVGPFAISGGDLPETWPAGIVSGAMRLRMQVNGDPQRAVELTPSGQGAAYVASGVGSTVIRAGDSAAIDALVTPSDCRAVERPMSPLVDASGTPVPVTEEAASVLRDTVAALCAPGGTAPLLTPEAARLDVFFRDRTLVVTALVSTQSDRVVMQPRDFPGFVGLEEQQAPVRNGVATVRLRWLISPAEGARLLAPAVSVRAFTIVGGRAYPWVVSLPLPAPARNDGVDLAEVAPRPTG